MCAPDQKLAAHHLMPILREPTDVRLTCRVVICTAQGGYRELEELQADLCASRGLAAAMGSRGGAASLFACAPRSPARAMPVEASPPAPPAHAGPALACPPRPRCELVARGTLRPQRPRHTPPHSPLPSRSTTPSNATREMPCHLVLPERPSRDEFDK